MFGGVSRRDAVAEIENMFRAKFVRILSSPAFMFRRP